MLVFMCFIHTRVNDLLILAEGHLRASSLPLGLLDVQVALLDGKSRYALVVCRVELSQVLHKNINTSIRFNLPGGNYLFTVVCLPTYKDQNVHLARSLLRVSRVDLSTLRPPHRCHLLQCWAASVASLSACTLAWTRRTTWWSRWAPAEVYGAPGEFCPKRCHGLEKGIKLCYLLLSSDFFQFPCYTQYLCSFFLVVHSFNNILYTYKILFLLLTCVLYEMLL